MKNFDISFPGINEVLRMIYVRGTQESPYLFGEANKQQEIHIPDFFMSHYTVTQRLFDHVMGNNDGVATERMPATKASYNSITGKDGFLERLNGLMKTQGFAQNAIADFRLPAETEWEYAARGGIHWKDNFDYSGSNDIDEVAWYLGNGNREVHPSGQKKPNQLWIHDLCGNVWEWCEDYFVRDTNLIPKDGSPCLLESRERVLRGGCNHNGAVHCRTDKRYEIVPDAEDENIGLRLAVSSFNGHLPHYVN